MLKAEHIEDSSKWISTPFSRRYNNRRLKICLLVAVKSLLQCFHLKTLLSFQSMTSENLCEPSPILAPLVEILCEPRRLWRHGSRAPGYSCSDLLRGLILVSIFLVHEPPAGYEIRKGKQNNGMALQRLAGSGRMLERDHVPLRNATDSCWNR